MLSLTRLLSFRDESASKTRARESRAATAKATHTEDESAPFSGQTNVSRSSHEPLVIGFGGERVRVEIRGKRGELSASGMRLA